MCWGKTSRDFGGLNTNIARGRPILSISMFTISVVLSFLHKLINAALQHCNVALQFTNALTITRFFLLGKSMNGKWGTLTVC